MKKGSKIKNLIAIIFLAFLANLTFAQENEEPRECIVNPDTWRITLNNSISQYKEKMDDSVFFSFLPNLIDIYPEIYNLTKDIDSILARMLVVERSRLEPEVTKFYSRLYAATLLAAVRGEEENIYPLLEANGHGERSPHSGEEGSRHTLQIFAGDEMAGNFNTGNNSVNWYPENSYSSLLGAVHEFFGHGLDAFQIETPNTLFFVDGILWNLDPGSETGEQLKLEIQRFFSELAGYSDSEYIVSRVKYFEVEVSSYGTQANAAYSEGIAIYMELLFLQSIPGCEQLVPVDFNDFPVTNELLADAMDLSRFNDPINDESESESSGPLSIESW